MQHKVEVKLRHGAIGAAPDVRVFFRFVNAPDSIDEVVEFLACHGFPVGFKELDGIKFITTKHGDMQKIPFNNYVSVTHAPDDSPHIIYFNTETFLKLYEFDKRHTVLKLQNLLDYHPCAKRCNEVDYSFFMTYCDLPSLELLRIYATEFGKAFRLTHGGCAVLTDSIGSTVVEEGQTVRVDAEGTLTVVSGELVPKFLEYRMRPVRERAHMLISNCLSIAYDGTARCRFALLDRVNSKRLQAKFLTNSQGLVLNVMGNQTPVNVGDYIVAHDLDTDYSKVEVVTASDYQATYIETDEEYIMSDKEKKVKKEKKGGKTLHNSTNSPAMQNVSDLQKYGDCDSFKLISKASSQSEDWMKSTKALEIPGVGCVVQVTTQQGTEVAEALAFVPGVRIDLIGGDKKNGRRLVQLNAPSALGDIAENWPTRIQPVQDSLPAQGVAEIVDGINTRHTKPVAGVANFVGQHNAHLFRGVFNARRRVAYHDMIRFDGTAESADHVMEWVNNSTDICRVVYDKAMSFDTIALKWDGEFPLTPINVDDFIVHTGNGHFRVMGEAAVTAEYDLDYTGSTDPVVKEVAETAQGSAYAPRYLIDAEGNTVVAYQYDGSPLCAGLIVNAALKCANYCVSYGRNGLAIAAISPEELDCYVQQDAFVVISGNDVFTGNREWLNSKYSPVLS